MYTVLRLRLAYVLLRRGEGDRALDDGGNVVGKQFRKNAEINSVINIQRLLFQINTSVFP
jgi:hypothetical protein